MKSLSLVITFFITTTLLVAQPVFSSSYPDTLDKARLNIVTGVSAGSYITGISFLGFVWYQDHDRVPFHYYNDSKGYLQMDKAGHSFSAYRESYAMYYALRWAGLDKKKSLIFGGPAGFIFQAPIEVFDGLYEGWGFSWSDIGANAFGSLLFMSQQMFFEKQLVMMKFSYSPSGYPKYHSDLGESELESFFLDYNAHTYWFSANARPITGIKSIPKWVNIAFGYSANGMIEEFENPQFYEQKPFPHLERYRQYIFSLDIDFSKIPTKKRWLQTVFRAANLVKIPFPAIELNRVDGLQFRPLYF